MKKKTIIALMGIMGVSMLCGCAQKESVAKKVGGTTSVESVIQNAVEKENQLSETEEASSEEAKAEDSTKENENASEIKEDSVSRKASIAEADSIIKNVDIDMTEMNSDMIYSTVYQLMTEPDSYVGKTIRLKGNYTASWYDPTSQYYHYAIIQDATACCAQGLEFLLKDTSLSYPDDYPEDEQEIVVVGTFETYTEEGDDNLYCRLGDAVIESTQ